MSKRASSGKAKDKGPARDRPEGRPPNRPSYQPRGRPTGHLVARLTGASLGRGGRGGSSSTLGNGDQFADDRGNTWEYLDEDIRPSCRPSGRGDSTSATRDGDHIANNYREYFEESMLVMESWQYRRGSHMSDTPHTQSSLKSWSDMIDRVWQRKLVAGRENRHTFVDGRVSKHTASSIWIDLHHLRKVKERDGPVSSIEVYQRCHMKRGLVSEYITARANNVAEKCSDLIEEKYGADRACHPRVGDREIWERACGGPYKKEDFLGLVPRWISIWP